MKFFYDEAFDQFSMNMGAIEAQARALVLERAGITLFKTDSNGSFEKIGVSNTLDSNGNIVYHVDDCE